MSKLASEFPDVEIGKKYRVLHGPHSGQFGIALTQEMSDFGHKWATLKLEDGTVTEPIRTKLLIKGKKKEKMRNFIGVRLDAGELVPDHV